MRVAKTKAMISFAVTTKLICVFIFAYAKSRFSHDARVLVYSTCMQCEINKHYFDHVIQIRLYCFIPHLDAFIIVLPTSQNKVCDTHEY